MTPRVLIVIAAIAGALAVAIGAFGAHGLADLLQSKGLEAELVQRRIAQFDTGARYHLVHAVVLLALLPLLQQGGKWIAASAWMMTAGMVFFSGSLYVLVVTNTPWLGAITPIGGVLWIAAWILLAFAPLQR
jgi:uncharacterized membrane protein YgdD (TMEM256/DUF423 family)